MMTDAKIIYCNTYDQNHVLSKCDNIVLEAKRVLLNEDLEKMANFSLSIATKHQQDEKCTVTENSTIRLCKNHIDWNDDSFWEDLPFPRNNNDMGTNSSIPRHFHEENQIVNKVIDELLYPYVNHESDSPKSSEMNLCLKYFNLWKQKIKYMKDQKKTYDNKVYEKKKLDTFMKKLRMSKKRRKENYRVTTKTELMPRDSNISSKNNDSTSLPKSFKPSGNYKHRFDAQKDIIDKQKAKLDEQNKIIEELKFGIIREDLLKSTETTKVNIREIFANCSESVKCKMPITLMDETNFTVSSQKAPKIVRKMEQRAVERAQNREIIQERKRVMQDHRQRLLEEAIEKKKVLEEEDRKRNLEIMKERRKKELEMEKIRQANKQRYLDNLNAAILHHSKFILKKYLKKLFDNMQLSREKYSLACLHFENKTLQSNLNSWLNYMDDLYKVKNDLADAHFEYKILKQCLNKWKTEHLENVRNLQVAEDIFDFRLTNNTFINWHRYVCIQIMMQDKYKKLAERHYNRKILFHSFHQWRSLKAVVALEKAKELRKQKWREKVWEILPDYAPPVDF